VTSGGPLLGVGALVAGANRKATVVLLAATVLGVLFRYVGSREFYLADLAGTQTRAAAADAAMYHFAAAFVLLGAVPFAITKIVFRARAAEFGVCAGDGRLLLRACAVLVPVMALLSFGASKQAPFQAEYPLSPAAADGAGPFALHATAYLLLYYTAWEFCFRGFLQAGLAPSIGDWNAILVQTSLSTALHVGKPLGETLGAVAGGILWGVLALRTRSILAGIVTHAALGISLDLFLVSG